ncbi:MAG: hypothetical protein KDE51_06600, partial [Anaerolineales bacterium]|nr:hypothetical protein [Anaerolineales bacterium]
MDLLQRLTNATSDEERQLIVLEFSLSALPEAVQTAVQAAAIPHWFDALFLDALLEDDVREAFKSQDGFETLVALNFVELTPGRGYSIHEQTRQLLLKQLWQKETRSHFRTLSRRAADYCKTQNLDDPEWQIERIYHLLVGDPSVGSAELRQALAHWYRFDQQAYEQAERLLRVAREHADAERILNNEAGWVRMWQANINLLYKKSKSAAAQLEQVNWENEDSSTTETPFQEQQKLLLQAAYYSTSGELNEQDNNIPEALTAY